MDDDPDAPRIIMTLGDEFEDEHILRPVKEGINTFIPLCGAIKSYNLKWQGVLRPPERGNVVQCPACRKLFTESLPICFYFTTYFPDLQS